MRTIEKELTAIPAAVAARNLRKELKAVFPGVKFSVSGTRSDWGMQEGTLDIRWTDGPTRDEVESIAKKYKGIKMDLDPYTDLWEAARIDNGDGTYYGVGSVYVYRDCSEDILTSIVNKMMTVAGVDTPEELNVILVADDGVTDAPIYHHFLPEGATSISLGDYRPDLEVVSRWAFHQNDAVSLLTLAA